MRGARLFVFGPRLPFGFRAGASIPVDQLFKPKPVARASEVPSLSYVYVIAADNGMVKVGYTTNPDRRLAALQTGSTAKLRIVYAMATNIDPRQVEAEAHRLLDGHRCAGEWFDVTPEIAEETLRKVSTSFELTHVADTTSETPDAAQRSAVDALARHPDGERLTAKDLGLLLLKLTFGVVAGLVIFGCAWVIVQIVQAPS